MSRYLKKTEEEKRYNRLMGKIKAQITLRLKKPMPRQIDWETKEQRHYWDNTTKREVQYQDWKAAKYDILGKNKEPKFDFIAEINKDMEKI